MEKRAYDTGYSQAVTHPSTNPARPGLTSVIRREPVFSRWYGRRQEKRVKNKHQLVVLLCYVFQYCDVV